MSDQPDRAEAPATRTRAEPAARQHRRGWRSWEKAHHRAIMLVLEGVCALVAGLLVLVVLLAVRLDMAPLQLNFLTPPLVSWLDGQVAPLKVEVGGTSIRWALGRDSIDLDLTDLKVIDPTDGEAVVSVPSASAAIALRPLLLGQVRPLRLDILRAHLSLVREVDGSWALDGAIPSKMHSGLSPEALLERTDDLFSSAHRIDRGGHPLTTILVTGVDADVDDQMAGTHWRIDDGRIALAGHRQGFGADSSLNVTLPGAGKDMGGKDVGGNDVGGKAIGGKASGQAAGNVTARLDGHIDFTRAGEPVQVKLSTTPVDPSRWAVLTPTASQLLARVHLPVGGSIEGFVRPPQTGADWRLGQVSVALTTGAGSIEDPYFKDGKLTLSHADLNAHYDPRAKLLVLDRLAADLGGPKATVDVTVEQVPDDPAVVLDRLTGKDRQAAEAGIPLTFHVVGGPATLDELTPKWPDDLMPKTHGWISEHMSKGTLDHIDFSQKLRVYPGTDRKPDKLTTSGTMSLSNVTLDYLHGLPVGTDLGADVVFSLHDTIFTLHPGGKVSTFKLRGGQFNIDKMDIPDEPSWITIDLDLTGSARDGAGMLTSEKLHLPLPFKPAQVDGTYDGKLHLHFPLIKDVPRDQIEYAARAKLLDFGLRNAVSNIDITDGDLDLAVDNNRVSVEGPAKLDGTQAQLKLVQPLSGPKPHVTDFTVRTTLDDAMRKRLKLNIEGGSLTGPVGLDMHWRGVDRDNATADIALDFTRAAIGINLVDWHKPVGQSAYSRFTAVLRRGRLAELRNLESKGPGLDLKGSVVFDTAGKVSSFAADRLVLNSNRAKGSIRQDANGWHIRLSGQVIDLTPYIKNVNGKIAPEERRKAAPVDLTIDAGRLLLGPKRELDQARLSMAFAHLNLMRADIAGQAGKGPIRIIIAPPETGGVIDISAGDFGAFLHVAGISDQISGGRGELHGVAPMNGDHRRYTGHVTAADYRVVGAPLMAKLLSLASLSSISSQLNGHGIPFDTLTGDLVYEDGVVGLSNMHASGNALGINAEGRVDLGAKTLALKGTLVPAYMFNSAVGKIPLIGRALVGGKGQGMFSINFSLGGDIDNPTALVNPLSLFAPGPIRRIPLFDVPVLSGGAAKPKPVPPSVAPPPHARPAQPVAPIPARPPAS
ncbi:MAG TPA: AsmA-like C-terminal domain-containing protein [Stellaceae bacterium]|nr:AsmA-like C-terminal domain-containing protein [Stellaceae bacterium]